MRKVNRSCFRKVTGAFAEAVKNCKKAVMYSCFRDAAGSIGKKKKKGSKLGSFTYGIVCFMVEFGSNKAKTDISTPEIVNHGVLTKLFFPWRKNVGF